MKQWYEKLFENYGNNYEKEVYTTGTMAEVDFIEKEINHDKSLAILDIGCGTGRHSIELAGRGYKVTGLDLSLSMLNKAKEKAQNAGFQVNFIQKDARDFDFHETFDLAIMLCEGAFPLMETDEMNYKILQNAFKSLKNPGKYIFTTLNGLFPLVHSTKDFINDNSKTEVARSSNFDLMTFRDYSVFEHENDDGNKITLECNERYYMPSEITWLLKTAGFNKSDIYGCKPGAYSRNDKLTHDDFEMLVIAEKFLQKS